MTNFVYDQRGHPNWTDLAGGTATPDTYDDVGRKIASTDQNGATL
jgi:YD repeat-containing protein